MKPTFKLFKRGRSWYSQEISTGRRKSLNTSNKSEAEQILSAMNIASGNAAFQESLADAYLGAMASNLNRMTWGEVMNEFSSQGGESTVERKNRVFRNRAFEDLKTIKLLDTSPKDLLHVMRERTTAVIVYLRQLQNYAIDMGYINRAVLPTKRFPKPKKKSRRRAISEEEHQRIVKAEKISCPPAPVSPHKGPGKGRSGAKVFNQSSVLAACDDRSGWSHSPRI